MAAETTMMMTATTMMATTTMATEARDVEKKPARARWRVSARVRILGWVVLLLVVAGAAALLLQRRVLLENLDAEVEAALLQEAEELRRLAAGSDPATGELFAGDVRAIFETFLRRNVPAEGEVLLSFVDGVPGSATPSPYSLGTDPALVARWANLVQSDQGEIETPAGPARFLSIPLLGPSGATQGVFVVAIFLEDELAEIDQATRVGAIVYGSILVVAIGIAWLIAGRVLAPIREITETARALTETDLSRRIAVPAGDDETAVLARTFNDMLGRLEHAFGSQRDFLNYAGHELRTPITIIRGHLEVEGDDPAERVETRALVLDELDRMARLVDDLLVLARAEQPDFLRRELVDVDVLTSDLLAKGRALADRDWRLAGVGHGVIRADRQRLTQAVMNLLDNAARNTDTGAVIELGSGVRDGRAWFWVRDQGPGVPLDEQARIFERFARGHDGLRRAGTAGLGLSIARAVTDAHGGTITVDSRPGAGATFTISVPAL